MSFISYAQNLEDVMLWRALKHVECGFYIDIGAWSPLVDSVTHAFYERSWYGINVEPNPKYLQELNERRPRDINLGYAVSDHDGRGRIAILENPGLSTLDESVAAGHEQSGYSAAYHDVELVTLRKICKTYLPPGKPVHFLKVDVEGLEQQVLQGNDWNAYRPWIVVVEATQPLCPIETYTAWESILEEADYRFEYADGLNRFYVAAEHAELTTAFRYPPNYFDDFVTYARWAAERAAEGARERIEQLSAELKQAQREIEELRGQIYHWQSAAEAVRSELDAVYQSKSWRATAPLRKTGAICRKIRGINIGSLLRQSLSWLILLIKKCPRVRKILSRSISKFPGLNVLIRNQVLGQQLSQSLGTYQRGEAPQLLTPRAMDIYRDVKDGLGDDREGRI